MKEYLKTQITKLNLLLIIKVDGYRFLKYLQAILKALKKNQASMGPIAIRICYLIYCHFVRTSVHLPR